MNARVSKEVLTENRQQLEQLRNERCKLIEEVRRVAPDDLPAWAQ